MKDHVNHALDIPLYRRMLRIEARWYIDAYGKQIDANKKLLDLAILDFKMVQSIHRRDLQEEKTGLVRNLGFIRDRLMEIWNASFGVLEWYLNLNTIIEMGYDTLTAQGINIIPILAKVDCTIWTHNNYMSALEDYLDKTWRSASGMVILTRGYFLIYQGFKNDSVESLDKKRDLYKWSSMLFRLFNDLATSSEVAREHIETLIDKAWMKMIKARIVCSEHLTDPSMIWPKILLEFQIVRTNMGTELKLKRLELRTR
ncbi:(E)-beta-ocimene synthase, chloroplastic [Artemisia annua]|uniref:(E)-beta-ocimene synthase, chloroplastic n=1 Tax=Artemisia annua TaxID=35608 RepID=A0A2U1NTM3_ARTAN|nr:(E)-beta-ocimene synthase, chloroplastic [Artemisia annua]